MIFLPRYIWAENDNKAILFRLNIRSSGWQFDGLLVKIQHYSSVTSKQIVIAKYWLEENEPLSYR